MHLCLDVTQASHTHDAIAEAAQLMKEAVDDIMVTLNEAASEVGMVGGMVESIAEAMAKVSAAGQKLVIRTHRNKDISFPCQDCNWSIHTHSTLVIRHLLHHLPPPVVQ